jgi:hypothetical protein
MCGLAGFARQTKWGDVRTSMAIVENLLVEVGHRGRHATGVAAVTSDGQCNIWKRAADVASVVKSDAWRDVMAEFGKTDVTMFLGHVRQSTHQHNKDKDDAAHPFYEEGVVGAHNGVIANWREVGQKLQMGKDWDVDSQAAIGALARMKSPIKALSLLEGWFALTWVKKGKLFMVRAGGSPLACAYLPVPRTLFWCSEMRALKEVVEKATPKGMQIDFFETQDERLYEYDVRIFGMSANAKKTDVSLPKAKTRVVVTRGYGGNWDGVNAKELPSTTGYHGQTGRKYDSTKGFDYRSMSEQNIMLDQHAEQLGRLWSMVGSLNLRAKRAEDAYAEILTRLEFYEGKLIEYGFLDEPFEEPVPEKIETGQGQLELADEATDEERGAVIAALEAGVEQLTQEVAALTEQVKTTEQADGQVYLDESAVTPVAICEYCKQGEKPGDKMWEGANGSFIHDSCIFDSQPVAMD